MTITSIVFNLLAGLATINFWLLFLAMRDYIDARNETNDRDIRLLALGHVRRKFMRTLVLVSVGLGIGHRLFFGTPFAPPVPLILTVVILVAITVDVVGDIIDRYRLHRLF